MAITTRWLEVGEEDIGRRYIGLLWRKDHILARSREMFSWCYRPQPGKRTLGFIIAEDGGVPCACMGTTYFNAHIGETSLSAQTGAILAVASSHRRGGFAFRLLGEFYQTCDLVVAVTIREPNFTMHRMMKWYTNDAMPRYLCVANSDPLERLLQLTNNPRGLRIEDYSKCNRLRRNHSLTSSRYTAVSLDEKNLPEWDAAWNTHLRPRIFGTVKDADYLRWRYFAHPLFKFQGILLRDREGKVCGLAVLRVAEPYTDCKLVKIMEFLPVDSTAGETLADAVAQSIPPETAYVEHIATGAFWEALQSIGLTDKNGDLFSTRSNPPDLAFTTMNCLCELKSPLMTSRDFFESPLTYITSADMYYDLPQ